MTELLKKKCCCDGEPPPGLICYHECLWCDTHPPGLSETCDPEDGPCCNEDYDEIYAECAGTGCIHEGFTLVECAVYVPHDTALAYYALLGGNPQLDKICFTHNGFHYMLLPPLAVCVETPIPEGCPPVLTFLPGAKLSADCTCCCDPDCVVDPFPGASCPNECSQCDDGFVVVIPDIQVDINTACPYTIPGETVPVFRQNCSDPDDKVCFWRSIDCNGKIFETTVTYFCNGQPHVIPVTWDVQIFCQSLNEFIGPRWVIQITVNNCIGFYFKQIDAQDGNNDPCPLFQEAEATYTLYFPDPEDNSCGMPTTVQIL